MKPQFPIRAAQTAALCALTAVLMLSVMLLSAGQARADLVRDRMNVLAGAEAPVVIEADSLEYDRKSGVYTATGSVKISQGDTVLNSDTATLDTATGQASASGRVTLTDRENVLLAESASVNFDTSLGVIEKGSIFVKKENYHITGERLERVAPDEYKVLSGSLTTCDADVPFWRVTASDLDVKMDRDVRASGVVLRIKEVPVLYTPYAWFPLLKPRTTGFLVPGVGFSTDDGFRFYNSFYWAPVDNFDATFSVDYRSERGAGLGALFRLALDRTSETRLYGYYMDDRKDLRQRYNVEFQHRQLFADRLSVKADINLSDSEFFRDLAETTKDRTQRSIDSNLFITDGWTDGMGYLFSQYTLGLGRNRDLIVQRLPELGFNLISRRLDGAPLYLDAEGSAAYFDKESGVTGSRLDLFPKLTGAFDMGGLMVLPRIGYRETMYALSGVDTFDVRDPVTGAVLYRRNIRYDDERGLFGTGVTVQTELSRLYGPGGGFIKAVKHTVEPKLAYNYVLMRGGGDFAKFDGIDTLGRRSMLAYSLTNRFVFKYGPEDGPAKFDYLTVKLGQFYDHHKDTEVSGVERYFSSLYGEAVYMAAYGMTLTTDFRYDFHTGNLLSVNTDLKYTEEAGRWHVLVGQRLSTDTDQTFMSPSRFDFFTPSTDYLSQFIVADRNESDRVNFLLFGAGVKLPGGWSVSGKVWYDMHTDRVRETDLSARYESQCWGVRAEFSDRPGEKQIMVMLDFKGMGVVKI